MGVHQCEQWQMRESAKGGWYCAACGQPEKPKDMAAVLLDHQPKTGVRDMLRHCVCGWKGSHLPAEAAARQFLKHQAEALEAAGFGRRTEQVAEVVADSSKVFMVMCQDPEAHARSFNEGYEAAVTQGLADDPSLADDWFQAQIREARAAALEQAAKEMREERQSWCLDEAGRHWIKRTLDDLAERATAERRGQ